MEKNYDAIVVGGGHAGTEAGLALARLNKKTLLMTISLNSIGYLACNPNIGGTAKGHLVKEIDALGGEMGKIADSVTIQTKMLNMGNGPAVHSLRNQVDKDMYHLKAKLSLERQFGLDIIEAEAEEIIVKNNSVVGIKTTIGDTYFASAIVLATGVYLDSRIIIGNYVKASGPSGYLRSENLSQNLVNHGLNIRRFKTGTPPRVLRSSVDFSKTEPQYGDKGIPKFSFATEVDVKNDAICYLTYTNLDTHSVILNNLDKAPLYNGGISGTGPRYCPSIEDKVVRFKDKHRHQIFIEPEGDFTDEMYVQGLSTSMPFDIQEQMVKSIVGLEDAKITRYGYAIEYDCLDPLELYPSLELKKIKGLFAGGQINGSSGYEEAAAQGLVAGINASRHIDGLPPLILGREQAYIGVLIDDLVTKGTNEPYRMMTSRAEHRLHLRQDNADIRLTQIGKDIGLVDEKRWQRFLKRKIEIETILGMCSRGYSTKKVEAVFESFNESLPKNSISAKDILKRTLLHYDALLKIDDEFLVFDKENLSYVEVFLKYEGYLDKQKNAIEELAKLENKRIPIDFDYNKIEGLRIEAKQKLMKILPMTIAQAAGISGVTPADITVLLFSLRN